MKVLFVWPIVRPEEPPYHIPFSLAQIAAVSESLGHACAFLDVNAHRFGLDVLRAEARADEFDVVAISGLTSQYKYIKQYLPILREVQPNALIVAGGGFITSQPYEMMKFLPQIDVACIGEGENTWVEICDHVFDRRFEEVKGVIFRDEKGNIKMTEPRPLIGMKDSGLFESLDDLPYPAYDLLPMDVYLRNSQIPLCVPPDTLIAGSYKPISEIKLGEKVIGGKVKRIFRRPYNGCLICIKAVGLLPIKVTPEHPILISEIKRKKLRKIRIFKRPIFKAAKDVRTSNSYLKDGGDAVVIPIIKGSFRKRTLDLTQYIKGSYSKCKTFHLNNLTSWLLGLYTADGSVSKKGIRIYLSNKDKKTIDKAKKIFESLGYSTCIIPQPAESCLRIECSSIVLARAFKDWCGDSAHNKRVPEFIFYNADNRIKRSFLSGFLAGDGYHEKRGWWRATTASMKLALQLQLIGFSLRMNSLIYQTKRRGKRIAERKIKDFHGYEIWFKSTKSRSSRIRIGKNFIFSPITSIYTENYQGEVWNIETSEKTYLVSNAIVHNCPETMRPDLRRISITHERGCPFRCRFCTHLGMSATDLARIYGREFKGWPVVRRPSPKYYIEHIKYLRMKFCVNFISILDENILADKKFCLEFADLMEKEGLVGLVRFGILGHPTSADPQVISRLRDVGCVPPGTLVFSNPSLKPIEELHVGDIVLTHEGRFKPITKTFRRKYEGKLVKIFPVGDLPASFTPEHPLRIVQTKSCKRQNDTICKPLCTQARPRWRKDRNRWETNCRNPWFKEYEERWVPAEEVRKGDLLVYPIFKEVEDIEYITIVPQEVRDWYELYKKAIKLHQKGLGRVAISRILGVRPQTVGSWIYFGKNPRNKYGNIKEKVRVDGNLMRLIGYYLAEGYSDPSRDRVSFAFGSHEKEYIADVKSLVKKVFGVNAFERVRGTRCEINVFSKFIANFFSQFGKDAYNKSIPLWVLKLPPNKQKELIKGYWRGDGCKAEVEFLVTSSSIQLIQGIKTILLRLGILPTIYYTKGGKKMRIKGRSTICGPSYTLKLRGAFLKKACETLGIHHKWLEERAYTKYRGYIQNGKVYVPIRKIETVNYDGDVLNLEVEEDNSYTVNSFITAHNCSYISFGAESSDQKILDALHKHSSPEAIQNAIDTCMKFEVYPITTWMVTPQDNVETVLKTIRFWKRNQITCKPFYETAYPGTELFETYKDKIIDYFLEDEEKELIKKLEDEGRKGEAEEIKLRGLERYVERLGDATDLVVNLNPNFNELEMLGLQQAMFEKDERRIVKWAKLKSLPA
jgi:intein/homing endonuclease